MRRLAMALSILALSAGAQSYKPTAEEKQQVRAKMAELAKLLTAMKGRPLAEDAEIYYKASEWILRYEDEFYKPEYLTNTLGALDRGIARATELQGGNPSWPAQKGRLVRAYRSRVDGSVQPYGLIIPESYDGSRPVRLDLVLHGRGATLNEVSFIAAHDTAQPVPGNQDYIQLDVFGRTNNAYRWSGETDVLEALESVQKRYKIDPERIVLRGFSMGGAGAWDIGLHYPDRWAAVEAGAGFTETKRYAKRENLPPYQEATLHIYDAVDYALNAFNLPMVGYGGEDDPQLQASVNIREQLLKEGLGLPDLRVLFLVGPKTGHRFHPDSKKQSEEFIERAIAQRKMPSHIRFVTYTTRYNRCFGVSVDMLEKHYERAEVEMKGDAIRTRNVARLSLERPGPDITIDGEKPASGSSFEKKSGKWVVARKEDSGPRKRHGLQGPIDDAFMDSFLCVRPTGKPYHPAVNDYALTVLDRFSKEYAKWLRADVRVKEDKAVTKEDIANHNLILFGDPGSNSVLARVAGKLPIRWTRSSITASSRTFDAASHALVLIYPNPLNPKRYVVINSGHTFHDAEFRGTNALLYPRLGDYAVLKIGTEEVAIAGLFGENWN